MAFKVHTTHDDNVGSPFPGATAVSHLSVYDWSSPDGLKGGSAHVHLACSEGYVVIGGRGTLQTLCTDGFHEVELHPYRVVWFPPGVIHRLINHDNLQIVVIMQNSGLPEAGDCVLTFPSAHLADGTVYQQAASLAEPDTVSAPSGEAAMRRRDLAVEGFLALRQRFESEGPAALDAFYSAANDLVRERIPQWRSLFAAGALAAANGTAVVLADLERGEHSHLRSARSHALDPASIGAYGMCGRLTTYPWP